MNLALELSVTKHKGGLNRFNGLPTLLSASAVVQINYLVVSYIRFNSYNSMNHYGKQVNHEAYSDELKTSTGQI